jgi:hypothetical protein
MKTLLSAILLAAMLSTVSAADQDTRCYEMRVYYAAPGKLDELQARFRNHTCKLFEKHGMVNVGYWVPLENTENKLVYVLAHASRDAAKKSWAGFVGDPDWKKAQKESEANGRLVARLESYFMEATDYSPAIRSTVASPERTFELRTYTASAGNLAALDSRFRDHTVKLFSKHGMQNVAYWHLASDQKGAENKLIYLLAHQSKDAAAASFKAFREDPTWLAARKASEEKAGGSLTEGGMAGVKSEFLKPVDYSLMK